MEVGRRNLGSENELRQRRRSSGSRKKREALPLAMILSFNDRDVHPDCPNVSNPYHKCGRHCLHKIPSANNFLEAIRSDGDQELEKIADKKGVDPNCSHASNPYHKCAEYCLEKLSPEKLQDAGKKNQSGMNPKEEEKAIFTTEGRVKPACIYGSDLYHACADYCFQTALEDDQPGQSMRLKGFKQIEKVLSTKERTGFLPQCKHAPNPNSECTESCLRSVTDINLAEGEKAKRVSNKINTSTVHLNRTAPSRNEVDEYCYEDTSKKEQLKGAKEKKNEIDVTTQRGFTFECKNASSPYHVCVDNCFQSFPKREQHGQVIRLKSSKKGEKVMNNMESTENSEGVSFKIDKSSTLPNHKHVLNPCYEAIEYCLENNCGKEHPNGAMKSKEEKIVVTEKGEVNHVCKYASDPYNECTESCFQKLPIKDQRGKALKKLKEEEMADLPSERRVSPECKFVSNPYHACAKYCFQNALKREHHGQVTKLKSLKELKNLVSNKRITSGHPQCEYASNPYHKCAEYCFNKSIPISKIPALKINENKKEKSYALRRDDNPKYKDLSIYFHRCAEYCPEEISPKSKALEGSTAMVKEKRRNSSEENKRDLVEKISLNSTYIEASKLDHNYIESSEGIILQVGTEKSSMDSNYVEAFNPINNNFNFNNGISMNLQDLSNDLHSAKMVDICSHEVPTDMPPLHIDAFDLFQEWAQYCSQTKDAEGEIVKQGKKVGVGELTAKNGIGNCFLKDNDSANMEKVQAKGGFPRSFPILLLFLLLGFLLALLHWTQMIHSVVMSSEKNEETERMKHESYLDPKCKKGLLIHITNVLCTACH